MPKITKIMIDALGLGKPGKERFISEPETPGFGIRITKRGVGSYVVDYRNSEGRQRKMTLGRVGVIDPAEARKRARIQLAEVAGGGDPSAARRALRQAITVAELCDEYLKASENRIKASTLAMDRSRIEVHVKPLLGSRRATAVTTSDIEQFYQAIIVGKSATAARKAGRGGRTRGGAGVAGRTVSMLGTIFELARRRKLVRENPVRDVQTRPDRRRTRFLSMAEITRFGAALKAEEEVAPTAVAAIRFLLLTGFRRMEVLGMEWSWVDLPGQCVRFPDTKSGYQVRPIGKAAVELLDVNRRPVAGKWVFPATHGDGHFVGLPRVLKRVCDRADLTGVSPHVLRHSFATAVGSLGFSQIMVAGLLGHKLPGVTGRYIHSPDQALIGIADQVSAAIQEALDQRGKEAPTPAS